MALEEPDQSASSRWALEDELVLALDIIKHLKEQLRGRESRRSNNITPVEEIRGSHRGRGVPYCDMPPGRQDSEVTTWRAGTK
jgi:hypothetical protein